MIKKNGNAYILSIFNFNLSLLLILEFLPNGIEIQNF